MHLSSSNHTELGSLPDLPRDPDTFFQELTSRNHHFISPLTQIKLKNLKVLIAGCGSTGGACIESLARAGVMNFVLADNGNYELTNLNRQHARIPDLGMNKAEFHRREVLAINPFAKIVTADRGIDASNVQDFCQWSDIIFDAVDVTTASGIAAKIALHVEAKRLKKPVLSALDLGYRQWGKSFDYRVDSLDVLNGKVKAVRAAVHPIRALFEIYPVSAVPDHCIPLVLDLLEGKSSFASQLGCTSDLLSGIVVPVMIRYVERGELVSGWSIDLSDLGTSYLERAWGRLKAFPLRVRLRRRLSETA